MFDQKIIQILGPDAKFHHIGMAVKDFSELPHPVSIQYDDPVQKVRVAFVDLNGAKIEYIQPIQDDSPVSNSIKKGHKLVHLCFEVKSIEQSIASARKNGFSVISKPVPAVAFDQKKIVWLYSRVLGLIELVEI